MAESEFLTVHPDPIIRYGRSTDGIVIEAINAAFESTFGASTTENGGVSLQATLASDGTVSAVAEAIEAGDPVDRRVTCPVAEGTRPFRLRHIPGDGGGYLVYTDESEQVSRERDLEARNERLETFASVVSHDLRNPIDVAETYLEAAREDGDPEHFDRVADSLGRMRTLIDDVLALAREGQVVDDTERVTLASVAEAAWESVDTGEATLTLLDETATLQADPDRLQQLVENLVRNSLEHGGPDITVGTIDGQRTGWYLEDDGPGIPPDDRDEVFEPGVTSSTEGTGLGLAIVERIADAHGWTVAVTESDTDDGPASDNSADERVGSGGARFEFTETESLQPF
jgi:signal transduction histidine kinase